MNILIIGAGGREHAIGKKIKQSPKVNKVYCAPGNPGMTIDGIEQVDIHELDHQNLIEFAKKNQITWTFVGPEQPLLNGIVDDFQAAGLKIFGPTQSAAIIEGSKSFAKELMGKFGIPTARSKNFTTFTAAKQYIEEQGAPIVIKADGLAAGKGVVVALTVEEAVQAAKEMLEDHRFGDSGKLIVVEEFLSGEEFSLLAFVNGNEIYPMPISQDHKRAYDEDRGPNTGGMGAYTPVPQIADEVVEEAIQKILQPAADGMVELGRPFVGILYAGLIATPTGPKVIEFNARFGDPETQVVLSRLKSDFVQVIDELLKGQAPSELVWENEGYNVGVVVAAEGYPGDYLKGMPLPDFSTEDVTVYYAGVRKEEGNLVGSGGRIYLVESSGKTLTEARTNIYTALAAKDTNQTFYRTDIGAKGLRVTSKS
ncbi:phosphoribosylamine--glycine ligase [Enterococcus durans]|uniref:phosphoribosylamine--glycine ligase n=1 Tax=Enterococcus durans TaxID=53345 RepID=UPI003BEEED22